jgi:hypothetical protein
MLTNDDSLQKKVLLLNIPIFARRRIRGTPASIVNSGFRYNADGTQATRSTLKA